MIAGSIGMLPSASLGPRRDNGLRQALYEPIHGSAPDIAGNGLATPVGSILSLAMCLRHSFGHETDAALLEQAVSDTISGGARTADIAGPGEPVLHTAEMGDRILAALDAAGRI